jgi:hypothetical protein
MYSDFTLVRTKMVDRRNKPLCADETVFLLFKVIPAA